jgi:hypothetical protein
MRIEQLLREALPYGADASSSAEGEGEDDADVAQAEDGHVSGTEDGTKE